MSATGKAARLIKLISLTESKYNTYTRQELMNMLGISESTFYRYLDELRGYADVPIGYDEVSGGYRISQDYFMKKPNLKVSEALALVIAGNTLLNNRELPYYKEINIAIAKLMAVLPDKTSSLLDTLEGRIHFSLETLVDYSDYASTMDLINDAISDEVNLLMKYYTCSRNEITERKISPYIIDLKNGFFYLIAYCHWRKKIKTFRIDRIRELEATDAKFKYPDDFSLNDYLGNAWGMERREEEFKIKLKFSSKLARRMKKKRYHSTQKLEELEDGSLMISFVTCSLNEVEKWILGFGSGVEVLEPEILRKKVVKELKSMQEMYDAQR